MDKITIKEKETGIFFTAKLVEGNQYTIIKDREVITVGELLNDGTGIDLRDGFVMANINKDEIVILNRGKIAYLYMCGLYEDRIEEVERGIEKGIAFIYKKNPEVKKAIAEFNSNTVLKKYNSYFKTVNIAISKAKRN